MVVIYSKPSYLSFTDGATAVLILSHPVILLNGQPVPTKLMPSLRLPDSIQVLLTGLRAGIRVILRASALITAIAIFLRLLGSQRLVTLRSAEATPGLSAHCHPAIRGKVLQGLDQPTRSTTLLHPNSSVSFNRCAKSPRVLRMASALRE